MKDKKTRKEFILEYKEKTTSGGVYKITNTANGKYLIMADIDLKSYQNRFNFSIKTGGCLHPKLEKDFKKYGADVFKLEILEEIDMKEDENISMFKEKLKKLKEKYEEKHNKLMLY